MIKLFEHNEKAYEKLVKCLELNQITTINHATGTGKSFIILKLLYEYFRNKRILYICPTYYIFNQLVNEHMKVLGISYDEFFLFDNIIFPNILKMDMKKIAETYDVIIIDEYHRAGAKKWWIKIRELRDIILKNYPEKKIIGLTATYKRYLDDNRNMKDELFLGNCASTLELSTALLDSLLPAPKYINLPDFSYSKIDSLMSIVERKVFYEEDKKDFLKRINTFWRKTQIKTINVFMENLKKNAKYIVFNSSIRSIAENKARIRSWFKNYNITFIEVHSAQKREKNEENLKKFSEARNGLVFLFVVDVLNEGIHVKGVDGIIMFRHTKSPIIYFQQIGRLLSFSSRKEQLVILDMVDNLNSHDVITSLYADVIAEARKRIKDFPESSQKYEEILKNFSIIDYTQNLKEELQKLELELSDYNISRRRLDTAISTFTNTTDEIEKIQAHLDMYNFSEYIDFDRYRKIEKLGIIKTILEDDYLEKISGYSTLHEKRVEEANKFFSMFIRFCKANKRLPSIISMDVNERNLAAEITSRKILITSKQKRKLSSVINKFASNDIFELVYYGFDIDKKESIKLVSKIKEYIMQYNCINFNVLQFLKKNRDILDFDIDEFFEKKNSCKRHVLEFLNNNNRLPLYDTEDYEEVKLFLNLMSENQLKNYKLNLNFYEMYLKIQEVAKKLKEFVIENHRYPDSTKEEEKEIYYLYESYYKLLNSFEYLKEYDEILKLYTKNEILKSVISFIQNHNGELPYINGATEEEIMLAAQFSTYLGKYFDEDEKKLINTEISKFRVGNNFLNEYIIFLKRNKRYPNRNSNDPSEVDLAIRYYRNEKYLTAEDKKKIKNSVKISKKDLFRNTYFANIM